MRWLAIGLVVLPAPVFAQTLSCPIPREIPRPYVERVPDDEEPVVRPVTGYVLALSWSPQYCRGRATRPRERLQCRDGRFGFVLHGLWPQAAGGANPRWCAYAPRLPEALIRENLCISPSAQLIQHQWAKHGTCATTDARDYLRASKKLYAKLRYPDMASLARRGTTVAGFRRAFARANRWLPEASLGVATTRDDYLVEVKICLDAAFRPRRCNAYDRGRNASRPLRIRAAGRS
ncbi:ribonuclease T(2) [Sphingomonas gilva]|uniref:Ribonuclease T(2) n=1 Tax=Sphingomonas gilva TaxID=2305907 RepID=A0A396RSS9_9SPHN|nr:ribonuclease T(2) [Sphingomonas gilva]RHW17413.1 ribonuclease T(2) [Sphingomonas gilva]